MSERARSGERNEQLFNDIDAPDQEDMSSIPPSGELEPDYWITFDGFDRVEDYRNADYFEIEVEATFQRAIAGQDLDNVILEIDSLSLFYDMRNGACAGALFHSILKEALASPYSSDNELYTNTVKHIIKWRDLLRHYLTILDDRIEVILKFEEVCLEKTKEFSPLFSKILCFLYDTEILTEGAILFWAKEKEGVDEFHKIFTKQSEHFIKARAGEGMAADGVDRQRKMLLIDFMVIELNMVVLLLSLFSRYY